MKKFFNVAKFVVTNVDFILFLLLAIAFGTVTAAAFLSLFASGFDVLDSFIAFLFLIISASLLGTGAKECAYQYREEESSKYYEHLDNLVKSGEWARI